MFALVGIVFIALGLIVPIAIVISERDWPGGNVIKNSLCLIALGFACLYYLG